MAASKRKLVRILLIAIVLLALLVLAGPWLAIALFGKSILQKQLAAQLACAAEVGSMSGGWSGAKIDYLRISQPPGFESVTQPFLEMRGLDAKVSLLGALFGNLSADVQIERVDAAIARSATGATNIQKLLKPAPESEKPRARQTPSEKKVPPAFVLNFKLNNASVVAIDLESGATATIENILILANRVDPASPVRADISCGVRSPGSNGKLTAKGNYDLSTGAAELQLVTDRIDLAAFSPFLASTRIVGKMGGVLDGNIQLTWSAKGALASDGKLEITNLSLEGQKLKDAFREPRLEIVPKCSYSTETNIVGIDGFVIRSTPFTIRGSGTLDPRSGGTVDLDLEGDVARAQQAFAGFFPKDAQMEGSLTGKIQMKANPGAASNFTIQLAAKGLCAKGLGESAAVPTDGTVSIAGNASADYGEWTIDRATLDLGPIANASLAGKWKKAPALPEGAAPERVPGFIDADFQGSASIQKAAQRFRALLPAGLTLGGDLSISGKIKTNETQEMKFTIGATVADVRAAMGPREASAAPRAAWLDALEQHPLVEAKLQFAAGGMVDRRFDRFELTEMKLTTASGALEASLSASGGMWNIASNLHAKGQARASLQKLEPYLAGLVPARIQFAGEVVADVDCNAESGRVKGPISIVANNVSVTARPAGAGPRTALDDSLDRLQQSPVALEQLKIGGDLSMNRAQNELSIPNLAVVTTPNIAGVRGAVTAIVDSTSDAGSTMFDGEATADLDPLLKLAGAFVPAGTRASGMLTIKGRVAASRTKIEWNAGGRARNFSVEAPSVAALPAEQEMSFEAVGQFVPNAKGFNLTMQKTSIATQSGRLAADVSCNLTKTETQFSGEGRGTWSADLAFASALAPAMLPKGSSLGGALSGSFSVKTSGTTLQFESVSNVKNFQFASAGSGTPPLSDPNLGLALAGHYDNDRDELAVDRASVAAADRWVEARVRKMTVAGMRSGKGIRVDGAGDVRADLAKCLALFPGTLPADAAVAGAFSADFDIKNTGALTKFAMHAAADSFRLSTAPRAPGQAATEFKDSKITLDLAGYLDTSRSEIVFDTAQAGTAQSGLAANGKGIAVRSLSTDRKLEGQIALGAEGKSLTALAAPWLPEKLQFDGPGNVGIRLGGSLGAAPPKTLALDGDFHFPAVHYGDLRIDGGAGTWTLRDGLFQSEGMQAEFIQTTAAGQKKGQLAASVQMRIDDPDLPFGLSFKSVAIPAARSIGGPMSYVFPLLSGDFKFADFDGTVDSEGQLQGDAARWKETLRGSVIVDLKQVKLVGSGEFAQVLDLLKLNPLNSSYNSIRETSRIEKGRIHIEKIEVDGDASRLPLTGSVTFEGAMAVGVDLGRARLGKQLDPYRPIVSLFTPTFGGTVTEPKFRIETPSADKLMKAATKLAAGQLLGGQKFDIGKLSNLRSLGDLAGIAEEPAAPPGPVQPPPQKPGPGSPEPPGPQNPGTPPTQQVPPIDAPANPGGMPVALGRSFRALAKGKTKFQYSRLNEDAALAESLRQWLAAAPPPAHVKTKEARLADLLNRYEVALALAVAKELQNPLFFIQNGKKGVHGVSGFFEQPLGVSGATVTFESMKAELRKLAGDSVVFAIPGAADDLPWIDRTGFDAKNVQKAIADRAAEYLNRVQVTPKGLIAVQQYVFRSFKNDEDKIREVLKKNLPENHAALAKLDTAKLTKFPESLDLDQP